MALHDVHVFQSITHSVWFDDCILWQMLTIHGQGGVLMIEKGLIHPYTLDWTVIFCWKVCYVQDGLVISNSWYVVAGLEAIY